MIRSIVVVACVCAFVASVIACDVPMPGTTLGIYAVSGTPQTNTCGAGLEPPDPWTFNVELSRDPTFLYWNWLDGSAVLSGGLSGDSATMTLSQSGNVDGIDGGDGPCNMERDDSIAVTVAGGAVPSTFTATLTYDFSVVSGSSCTDQLSSNGGFYDTLPCTVSYVLAGTYQSAAP